MATYEILRSDELMHYGILGMKWGVRRYQNKDGSLTEKGKKRYGSNIRSVKEKQFRKQLDKRLGSPNSKAAEFDRKITQEAKAKVDKTNIGQNFNALNTMLLEAEKKVKEEHGPNAKLLLDADMKYLYDSLGTKYQQAIKEYLLSDDNLNKFSSLALRDLGYDDTEEGRQYVSDLMRKWQ